MVLRNRLTERQINILHEAGKMLDKALNLCRYEYD
jgi:hypothetical protein